MTHGFFPDDPPGEGEDPFAQSHERVPSFEPPRDEVPALFAAPEVIARGDDLVIAILGARVHSDGVEILIERHLRRGSRDAREWQLAQMDFTGHLGGGDRSPDRLRWGLVLGNGERLFLDDRFAPPSPVDPATDDVVRHSVRMTGGGGSGGGETYTMHDGLWLHPLPPDGPLELVVQWPAFGVPESRVILDGGAVSALAASARPLWG